MTSVHSLHSKATAFMCKENQTITKTCRVELTHLNFFSTNIWRIFCSETPNLLKLWQAFPLYACLARYKYVTYMWMHVILMHFASGCSLHIQSFNMLLSKVKPSPFKLREIHALSFIYDTYIIEVDIYVVWFISIVFDKFMKLCCDEHNWIVACGCVLLYFRIQHTLRCDSITGKPLKFLCTPPFVIKPITFA